MNTPAKYFIVEADAMPEIFRKVAEAKRLLETGEETAALRFQAEPDSIVDVRCWSDAHWSDPDAEAEPCALDGNTLQLKPGGYIYEVTARWDDSQGSGGTACYAFYIRSSHSSLCGYPPADSLGADPPIT